MTKTEDFCRYRLREFLEHCVVLHSSTRTVVPSAVPTLLLAGTLGTLSLRSHLLGVTGWSVGSPRWRRGITGDGGFGAAEACHRAAVAAKRGARPAARC